MHIMLVWFTTQVCFLGVPWYPDQNDPMLSGRCWMAVDPQPTSTTAEQCPWWGGGWEQGDRGATSCFRVVKNGEDRVASGSGVTANGSGMLMVGPSTSSVMAAWAHGAGQGGWGPGTV